MGSNEQSCSSQSPVPGIQCPLALSSTCTQYSRVTDREESALKSESREASAIGLYVHIQRVWRERERGTERDKTMVENDLHT